MRRMDMASLATLDDVVQWMCDAFRATGTLPRADAAKEIERRFGSAFRLQERKRESSDRQDGASGVQKCDRRRSLASMLPLLASSRCIGSGGEV